VEEGRFWDLCILNEISKKRRSLPKLSISEEIMVLALSVPDITLQIFFILRPLAAKQFPLDPYFLFWIYSPSPPLQPTWLKSNSYSISLPRAIQSRLNESMRVVYIWGLWDSTNSYFSYPLKFMKNSRISMIKLTKIANINQQNQWKMLGHYKSTSTCFSNSNKKTYFPSNKIQKPFKIYQIIT
jgi:hypothetical protein